MRQVVSLCLGALACLSLIGLAHARAQDSPTPTSTTAPTTTVVSTSTSSTSPSTTQRTPTTQRQPTTTVANRGRPVPPPPAGPSQTLVPDLLGTPVELPTTTTSLGQFAPLTSTTLVADDAATATIMSSKNSPSGLTLALAALAWLVSLGGVLVYAEERRASRWKHLAR